VFQGAAPATDVLHDVCAQFTPAAKHRRFTADSDEAFSGQSASTLYRIVFGPNRHTNVELHPHRLRLRGSIVN
jgi:hypothetical protein